MITTSSTKCIRITKKPKSFHIKLFNVLGELVVNTTLSSNTIELSHLNNGPYFVLVSDDNEVLFTAIEKYKKVIAVYCIDPKLFQNNSLYLFYGENNTNINR